MMGRWSQTAPWAKAGAYGLTSIVVACVLALSACNSAGDEVSNAGSSDAAASAPVAALPYYVEFRTRPYFSITHTFLVYGAQDSSGHPLEAKSAGFFPNAGAIGPFIGIIAIGGEVGDETYYVPLPSSTIFHRNLTAEQYERLTAYIDKERAESKVYNLIFNNCNDFVAGAADAIGLKVPFVHVLPPPVFIRLLADMNT
jgi:hypothetical protein